MSEPGDRPLTVAEFLESVGATVGWTFAKSMPTIPHEYVVRGVPGGPPTDWHDWMVRQIAEHGYQAKFYGRTYTYLEHDGFKYWVVGDVINREPLKTERAKEEATDGEEGAAEAEDD